MRTDQTKNLTTMMNQHTFTKMRGYDIDLDVGPDQTHARSLEAINAAFSRAEIAVPKVGVGFGAFQGGISG